MIYILAGTCMAFKIKTAKIIKLEDFKKSRSIVFFSTEETRSSQKLPLHVGLSYELVNVR